MIKCDDWPIGVCTWSLGNDFDKLRALKQQAGLNHLHLALSPALGTNGEGYIERIRQDGWDITATMIDFAQEDYSTLESIKITGGIVPDEYWQVNRDRVLEAIQITAGLGVQYLTLHFGFIDMIDSDSSAKIASRVKVLADAAAGKNVQLLMETGQETSVELREFLEELNHPALGVNFDPANMILYDKGDPIEAVGILGGWIKHVHIKDAVRTQTQGQWGTEVIWGTGEVVCRKFLEALKKEGFTGALAIEREAGDDRLGDIETAVEILAEDKK